MSLLSKIITPIDYLMISHSEKKWFDFILPITVSCIAVIIINILPKNISLIGKDSLISLVNGILQILSGFYIASMAAVATFQKKGMDNIMDGVAPTLRGKKLTRRRFLTYLFGYLAFMSITLYFVGGTVQLMSSSIKELHLSQYGWLKNLCLFVYLSFVCNILSTTALGMFFMIDKMHEEKPELIIPEANKVDNKNDDHP
ncbi:hypothetical protein ACSRB9_10990 [Salmonella enterica]|uniref:hypothetical protein n=1 Tax=Salmonella enterica TaxID=28901 RepID=UPI001965168A|nr:hypothetical protein [Salmonella enterica]EIC3510599.1 hypothetical protein [Salmonella enterica subsp. enterica serovar Oranienburg]HCV7461339.1 hypothetical protein [Salmonella enterica subsp. enterica serovar Bovismorbificans]EIS7724378.1 hypothetical protein [Salmonella enterica]EJV7864461.1 hypothetical protein [Salmonella enterica]EJX9836797.1 hypothetical protein [Salmonella enterica]